jgi:WD40 repeat protein
MLLGGARPNRKEVSRFLAEGKAIGTIEHPNVVRVFECGEDGGRPYMALEFVRGGTLADRIAAEGRLRPLAAAELVCGISQGVAAAHGAGIVHRDLKPGNVLLGGDGAPKVTDFGLAKIGGGTDLTQTGAVMGTPAYMAPEQAAGGGKYIGPPADVWSIGVILYECLTGTRPFRARGREDLLAQILIAPYEPVHTRQYPVPRDLREIVRKCLEKNPADRYATARELADDLERFRLGRPISVRPAGLIERGYKWARRKPTAAAAVGLAVVALSLGGLTIGAMRLWQDAESARGVAVGERKNAEAARDQLGLEKQATEAALRGAEVARDGERSARAEVDRLKYTDTINLLSGAYRAGSAGEAHDLLEECPAHLRNWEWRYFSRLCRPEQAAIPFPTERCWSAAFSGDDRRIFTVGSDSALRVWDAMDGRLLMTKQTDSSELVDIALSRDGRSLLVVGPGSVRVWDAEKLTERWAYRHAKATDYRQAWISPDGNRVAMSADDEGVVHVVEVGTGKESNVLVPDLGAVQAVHFLPADLRVASVGPTGQLCVSDVDGTLQLQCAGVFPHFWGPRQGGYPTRMVEISADGNRVLARGAFPHVFEIPSGKRLSLPPAQFSRSTKITHARFDPTGRTVVATTGGGQVCLYDAATGAMREPIHGAREALGFAVMSPDGKRIVGAGGSHQPLRVWDAAAPPEAEVLKAVTIANFSVSAFTRNGGRMLRTERGVVREWDVSRGTVLKTLAPPHATSVVRVAYSADGTRAATFSMRNEANPNCVRVWDLALGKVVREYTGDQIFIGLTSDGTGVYTAEGGGVTLCDVGSDRRQRLPGMTGIRAVSPDGLLLLTEEPTGPPKLRSATTGAVVLELADYPTARSSEVGLSSATFSADGRLLAATGADHHIHIWAVRTGERVVTLREFDASGASWMTFSGDGTRLMTGGTGLVNGRSAGAGMQLWDTATGRLVLSRSFLTGVVSEPGLLFNSATSGVFSSEGDVILGGAGTQVMGKLVASSRSVR